LSEYPTSDALSMQGGRPVSGVRRNFSRQVRLMSLAAV
jgi:hypothetical protein